MGLIYHAEDVKIDMTNKRKSSKKLTFFAIIIMEEISFLKLVNQLKDLKYCHSAFIS